MGSTSDGSNVLFAISAIMTFSTGIFLTGARLFEPLFRYILWVKYYQYYGTFYESKENITEEEMELKTNALSSFLSSSLNVELVYTLLESITTFSKKSSNAEDNAFLIQEKNQASKVNKLQQANIIPIDVNTSEERLSQQIKDQLNVMRTLTLNQILIKNVDKWDNAKSKDFVKKKEDNQGSDINVVQETQ